LYLGKGRVLQKFGAYEESLQDISQSRKNNLQNIPKTKFRKNSRQRFKLDKLCKENYNLTFYNI